MLPQILLVFGLQNDGVLQSKILVDNHKTKTSNDWSDEHPRASEYQWQNMKFIIFKRKHLTEFRLF